MVFTRLRTLLCCVCLALCLTCSEALAENQGTGKNCIKASDGPGGPKCQSSQIGVCCDASFHNDNCLTILGATAENADSSLPAGSLPSCASFSSATAEPLSAFCCDEMDVPDCVYGTSGASCVGDSNVFCCAHGGNGTGGTDCVNPYTTSSGCAEAAVAGVRHVILTLGPQGPLKGLDIQHLPAVPAQIVNPNDTGNCLVAGSLAYSLQGKTAVPALAQPI
ncbi:hypothetical protein WJX77_008455 [Trebouxia sp. C0004]